MNRHNAFTLFLILFYATLFIPHHAWADDPFATSAALPQNSAHRDLCAQLHPDHPLSIMEVIDLTMCNNPQIRSSWSAARMQAAQLGVSHASRLPTVSAQAGANQNNARSNGLSSSSQQQSLSLSANYLLYDFGGREADIENAQQLLQATHANYDSMMQTLFFSTVQAYYTLLSAQASVASFVVAEQSAQTAQQAAEARLQAGTATPSDQLQARTALSQAALNRIVAEGNVQTALGALASAMGFEPTQPLQLASPMAAIPDPVKEDAIGELIQQAQKQRPELRAAEAQIAAAEASIASSRAADLPKVSIDSTLSTANTRNGGMNSNRLNSSIGLNVAFPLFTGYRNSYQIEAAEARLETSMANRDQLTHQVSLEVWKAYQGVKTSSRTVRASEDLIESAKQSERMALGRYNAGVGNILDVLTAQSALANAQQQQLTAQYNWRIAKFTLAQAIGLLEPGLLNRQADSETKAQHTFNR